MQTLALQFFKNAGIIVIFGAFVVFLGLKKVKASRRLLCCAALRFDFRVEREVCLPRTFIIIYILHYPFTELRHLFSFRVFLIHSFSHIHYIFFFLFVFKVILKKKNPMMLIIGCG